MFSKDAFIPIKDTALFLTRTNDAYVTVLTTTVLPAKSDSDVMFCLQSYQELIIHRIGLHVVHK